MKIYMDDFTPYREIFQYFLDNLEDVLKIGIEMSYCLRNDKYYILMNEGIVLGHQISYYGIEVNPSKTRTSIAYLHHINKNM